MRVPVAVPGCCTSRATCGLLSRLSGPLLVIMSVNRSILDRPMGVLHSARPGDRPGHGVHASDCHPGRHSGSGSQRLRSAQALARNPVISCTSVSVSSATLPMSAAAGWLVAWISQPVRPGSAPRYAPPRSGVDATPTVLVAGAVVGPEARPITAAVAKACRRALNRAPGHRRLQSPTLRRRVRGFPARPRPTEIPQVRAAAAFPTGFPQTKRHSPAHGGTTAKVAP